ncbi:hypothetical protein [Sandaracinus amylolyticus]|uniref:hypothetical protein n=1 Tax=Sandaracinus amylolyticus TaxID=927083 RepID=UPI001F46DFAE|nr:hypothetical protein [Sandaracinus amylolyticus]
MPDPEENRFTHSPDLQVFERDDAEAALHLALAMLDEVAHANTHDAPAPEMPEA